MMFLTIITPCSRPENLQKIEESINIPKDRYRWIVVVDGNISYEGRHIYNNVPKNCELYYIDNSESVCGNAQRNYALDLIEDGWVYFNDDDTLIHPQLWKNIENRREDFISFIQLEKDGTMRLSGKNISLNNIDSHNFIISSHIIGRERWVLNRRDADGVFAYNCYQRAVSKIWINKPLSIYNSLK